MNGERIVVAAKKMRQCRPEETVFAQIEEMGPQTTEGKCVTIPTSDLDGVTMLRQGENSEMLPVTRVRTVLEWMAAAFFPAPRQGKTAHSRRPHAKTTTQRHPRPPAGYQGSLG